MKAVFLNEYGGPDKLKIGELGKPEPAEGEVLVRIRAAGVNPVDWKVREGYLKERMPVEFPVIPGWDVAGIVEERGLGAVRFKEGDPVFAYARKRVLHSGTFAEYICLSESYLAYKPRNLTFEEAAAVPLAALTAWQSLFDRAYLDRGETCLIVGASGGVGHFAVQLARLSGARVIAVASTKNSAFIERLGASCFIDYTKEDVAKAVRRLCPSGVDVALAAAGGGGLSACYDCVRQGGRLVTIVEKGDADLAAARGINLLYHFVEPNSLQLELFRKLIESGKLKVHLERVFPLEKASYALQLCQEGHTRGKMALQV